MAPLLALLVSLLSLTGFARASGGDGHEKLLPSETTELYSKAAYFPDYDSRRVTIKYAPVSVPPMTEHDGMALYFQRSTTLPCRDCFVTWLQMGLEHADGRAADPDTGMWLHHGVMMNRNQTDAVSGHRGQRFAASGNERTAIDISAGGTAKVGYYVGPAEEVALSVELMNMLHHRAQDDIVFTVTYEYIDGRNAGEFSAITPYWLDVGHCGSSAVPAYRDSAFNYSSPVLKGQPEGTITFVGGHLHDGGTHIDLIKNGEVICGVDATYNQYHNLDDDKHTDHISSIETCKNPGVTAPGDEWSIAAYYDTSLHEPMALMDGSLEPVMGIMLVYVAHGLGGQVKTRPRYWSIVLGLGFLTAVILSIAAWLWRRETRRIRIKHGTPVDGPLYRDLESEQDAAAPLIEP